MRKRYLSVALLLGAAVLAGSSAMPAYAGEWKRDTRGWWYAEDDGTWPAASWKKIDGLWYYFDGSGYMVANDYAGDYFLGPTGAWVPSKDKVYYNHNVHQHYETVCVELYNGSASDFQDCWQLRTKLYAYYDENGPVAKAANYESTIRIAKNAAISGAFSSTEELMANVDSAPSGTFWYLTDIRQDITGYIVEARVGTGHRS